LGEAFTVNRTISFKDHIPRTPEAGASSSTVLVDVKPVVTFDNVRQELGDRVYPLVYSILSLKDDQFLASKVTGMILDALSRSCAQLSDSEVLRIAEQKDFIEDSVAEALIALGHPPEQQQVNEPLITGVEDNEAVQNNRRLDEPTTPQWDAATDWSEVPSWDATAEWGNPSSWDGPDWNNPSSWEPKAEVPLWDTPAQQEVSKPYKELSYILREQLRLLKTEESHVAKQKRPKRRTVNPQDLVRRKCSVCNEVVFSFHPLLDASDRFLQVKEMIAIYKHRYTAHEEQRAMSKVVEIAMSFAKLNSKRRQLKTFEKVLDWIASGSWKGHTRFMSLLMKNLKDEAKKSAPVREKLQMLSRRYQNSIAKPNEVKV